MSRNRKTGSKKISRNYTTVFSYASIGLVVILFTILVIYNMQINNKKATSSDKISATSNPLNPSSTADKSSQTNWKSLAGKLETEGYTREDINTSGQYADRIIFELNEIGTYSSNQGTQPDTITADSSSDDNGKFTEIQPKIDRDKAVYLMVKLKKDFKSVENVFDEYLLSLQLNIDLNEYLTDKNLYEKTKNEKMSGMDTTGIITADKIEKKMLDNLQKQNEKNRSDNQNPNINSPGGNVSQPGISQPNVSEPHVDIPKPVDPAEELRKKIGQ